MGKTRRGKRHNPNFKPPPVVLRPLAVPVFRMPQPDELDTPRELVREWMRYGASEWSLRMAGGRKR